jgi:4-aminobutyrate aminotransferase-like enzyme
VLAVDLSPESPLYSEGNWREGLSLSATIRDLLLSSASPVTVGVSCYGETKLYATEIPSPLTPSTTSLFSELYLPVGTEIFAPFACLLSRDLEKQLLLLTAAGEGGITVLLRGVLLSEHLTQSEVRVQRGDLLGTLSSEPYSVNYSSGILLPPRLSVQLYVRRDPTHPLPPLFCSVDLFPHWTRLCPSPHALLPSPLSESQSALLSASPLSAHKEALLRRTKFVAAVQEHYFRDPPRMVRGCREFLFDDTGRGYLDMVNNVTVLGHCHPSITTAATSQLRLLNTNSRFLYRELGEFAELIVSTLPPTVSATLNKVLFVNSGSEATDLALRIARTVVTERRRRQERERAQEEGRSPLPPPRGDSLCRDTICLEGGYHGITTASDEVSTTLNDNPTALESRPPWIHLVPMPNKFRGRLQAEGEGKDTVGRYVEAVQQTIHSLTAASTPLSVFIAEPLSGNAGGVELPEGYLKQVYDAVHSAGALCISDEVQVGYGRLGTHFWGFEEHGVVPDLLTMAKAAGNGYPLGFVVTSEEIVKEFGVVGSFFSSAGGGPLSCAIGKTVLETLMKEGLQENARVVGAFLSTALQEIAERHPEHVGCIHGHGLYQGVEIISRQGTTEPGTIKAALLCEYLLRHGGVICHNTGDHSNVLKVKPPLCISLESAEFFVSSLDMALRMLNTARS